MSGISNMFLANTTLGGPRSFNIDTFTTTFLPADDTGVISSVPRGCFVNKEQTKVYTADDTGDLLRAGDITGTLDTYVENSVSVDVGRPFSVVVADTGESYYYDVSNTTVQQRDLSIPFDLSSAGGIVASISVAGDITSIRSMHASEDGLNFYPSQDGDVVWFELSTAWDLSTAVKRSVFNSDEISSGGWGVTMDASGTRLFMGVFSTHTIYQYNLSTRWDVSTAVYSGKTLTLTGGAAQSPVDFHMGYTGDVFYVHLFDTDSVIALRSSG